MQSKTVLIPLTQAVVVKNLLRTDVVKHLLSDKHTQVVCVGLSEERINHYKTIFSHPRLQYDWLVSKPSGRTERFFAFIKFYTIATETTAIKRVRAYKESGSLLSYYGGLTLERIASKPGVRKLLRLIDGRLVPKSPWATLLEKHKPDLIFFPNLFDDTEAALLRDARRAKIRTAGFINTWDKVTGRSGLRLVPDTMAVFNELVKEEVVRLADMKPETVIPVGLPQYDLLVHGVPISREDFCHKKGLAPSKKIILFAPLGSSFSNADWEMIDFIHQQISNGMIPNAELLVRFQPNDFANKVEIGARPWMKYDLPGIRFGSERGGDWDMTTEDLAYLLDTLTHISLLVCYASSISIDTALLDKPVINIDFEPVNTPPTQSSRFYYRTEHYGKALKTGGIRLVKNEGELLDSINQYLAEPKTDEEGRKRLIKEQVEFTDGNSAERLARFILRNLRDR